jgi:hypothetical protein
MQNVIQKKDQTATLLTLKRFWKLMNPYGLSYFTFNRDFHLNPHSMIFFLLILMRSLNDIQTLKAIFMKGTPNEKIIAYFTMDDIIKYIELIPDEILPPYRKNRQYINSILSANEISRAEFPNCKLAFGRVKRGAYTINPAIIWL